ncbi:alpha/beta hydrolase-fold protein [Kribbella jejuensis]|uniref:Acyl-CoA:diacylglycerol acyltransferase n=1 Tax=Kribbella jejuensis TaxID=236068 RepID=A0A542E868_9ACTN|nr:alpha/beta hydrolase-fold protein [Kribbella jejuensis]TQJ11531.1 enterochelin esterase-like enzyme [Kribbella jejuensis]
MPTRRTFVRTGAAAAITGAVSVAALESGAIPGRGRVHELLGLTGPDGVVPAVPAGPVVSGSFASRARGTDVGYSVIYPDGYTAGARLPVVLALHGRGGDHRSAVNDLGVDRFLSSAIRNGTPPFAIATVDGGQDSYWHRRADGDDPGYMLAEEFLPLLARRGLNTSRYGVFGWSMGGYGTLLHVLRETVKPIVAGAMSPALWHSYDDVQPGAFDDAADFARNQVFGHPGAFRDVAVRIDCGRDDPFAAAAHDLRTELGAAGGQQPGLHTGGYWRRMLPDQLRFLGTKLAN